MAKENAVLNKNNEFNEDLSDFLTSMIWKKLQSQLDEELAGLEFLREEKEK